MATQHTTRRAVLGATVAIPAAMIAAPSAVAALATAPDRSAWDRAFAAMEAAKREADDYSANVSRPAYAKADQALALAGHREPGPNALEPEIRATVERRKRIMQLAVPGIHEIGQRADDLTDRYVELEWALFLMPAPDAAALLWKYERLYFGPDCDEDGFSPSYKMEAIIALRDDTARLLGA